MEFGWTPEQQRRHADTVTAVREAFAQAPRGEGFYTRKDWLRLGELGLLGRTLLNLQAVIHALAPNLDIEAVVRPHLRQLMRQRLAQGLSLSGLAAESLELQNLVRQYGGTPDESGSAGGALHRGWVAVLGTLVGGSDLRMLEEAERGEDTALARYRKALKRDDLPPLLRGIIERQMDGVQRNHDQVKALRDVARAEA